MKATNDGSRCGQAIKYMKDSMTQYEAMKSISDLDKLCRCLCQADEKAKAATLPRVDGMLSMRQSGVSLDLMMDYLTYFGKSLPKSRTALYNALNAKHIDNGIHAAHNDHSWSSDCGGHSDSGHHDTYPYRARLNKLPPY